MRIVAWNCNMALRRKWDLLSELEPDLVIVAEASQRDVIDLGSSCAHWIGSNPKKGLGAICVDDVKVEIDRSYSEDFPYFLPLRFPELRLHILAVWASVRTYEYRYVRLTHHALDYYEPFIRQLPTVMIGDFNSNTIWDKQKGEFSHSNMVGRLAELGCRSLYHAQTGESQGKESIPTFFFYRHAARPFHIDYCFMPIDPVYGASLNIGRPEVWLQHSDHMPLILDLTLPNS